MQKGLPPVREAAAFIQDRWPTQPRVGLILGTGLGNYADRMEATVSVPYAEIPHFGRSTAVGHQGVLVCGQIGPTPVVAMQGRFHLYEGYAAAEVTFPIHVMRHLGADTLIVTNASGGLHPLLASGDVLVLEDQINLMFRNPLTGNSAPSHLDLHEPFDRELRALALATARAAGFPCREGVYAGLTGPTYETRAEYRMLRRLGADVVGMSSIPEVLVARHLGLRVLGLSAVTNLCRPDTLESTSGELVKAAAEGAEPRLRLIVDEVIRSLGTGTH